MKQKLFFLLRVIVLPILGAVTLPASAQTTAQGFYYPPSAWDLKLQCDTHATCPRFIVLSNWIDTSHPSGGAAVLDRETGLVWEQSPSTSTFPWSSTTTITAATHCNILNVGHRKGWRLPTIQEMESLVDGDPANTSSPRLPHGHPFSNNVHQPSSFHWSATTVATDTSLAWAVTFDNGGEFNNPKSGTAFAWCVRGGHGVDPQ
jgi:Protein of unknown function (DUF1566)